MMCDFSARGERELRLPAALKLLSAKTAEARKRIGSIWWNLLRLVEPVLLGEPRACGSRRFSGAPRHEASEDEEGIKVA